MSDKETDNVSLIEIEQFHKLLSLDLLNFDPAAEIDQKWELFVEHSSENVVCNIFRQPQANNSSLFEYFTTGLWKNVEIEKLYLSGFDGDFRSTWDENTLYFQVVDETFHDNDDLSTPSQTIHWFDQILNFFNFLKNIILCY